MSISARVEAVLPGEPKFRFVLPPQLESGARRRAEAEAVAALSEGRDVPTDVAAPIVEAMAIDALMAERHKVMLAAAEQLSSEWHAAAEASTGRVFEVLTEELERIRGEVLKLKKTLGRVRSADEAIDAEVASEWRRLGALVYEYSEARAIQMRYTSRAGLNVSPVAEVVATIGLYADAIEFHPRWVAARSAAFRARDGVTNDWLQGWLADGHNQMPLFTETEAMAWSKSWWPSPVLSKQAFILEVAEHQWFAPNPDDLEPILQAAAAATSVQPRDRSQASNVVALHRYYELTGGTPPKSLPNFDHFSEGSKVGGARFPKSIHTDRRN